MQVELLCKFGSWETRSNWQLLNTWKITVLQRARWLCLASVGPCLLVHLPYLPSCDVELLMTQQFKVYDLLKRGAIPLSTYFTALATLCSGLLTT